MELAETTQGKVALEFARAIVDGRPERAHALLSAEMHSRITARDLEGSYQDMIAYGDGRVTLVQVMNVLDEWPAKQAHDVGWAYVALAGDSFSEAIAVVVAREGEALVVRDIEWGRP